RVNSPGSGSDNVSEIGSDPGGLDTSDDELFGGVGAFRTLSNWGKLHTAALLRSSRGELGRGWDVIDRSQSRRSRHSGRGSVMTQYLPPRIPVARTSGPVLLVRKLLASATNSEG